MLKRARHLPWLVGVMAWLVLVIVVQPRIRLVIVFLRLNHVGIKGLFQCIWFFTLSSFFFLFAVLYQISLDRTILLLCRFYADSARCGFWLIFLQKFDVFPLS